MTYETIPTGAVEVPEIEVFDETHLSTDKTALVVVDMQNDFVRPEGTLHVPEAANTIPNIVSLLTAARKSAVRVAFTQDTHVKEDPEFDIWPEHCVDGTWGWQIIDELQPQEDELICRKNRYDGFYGTWLDHFLKNIWKVEHLVIVGTVSNICVAHTAASAGLRWYHVVVPADGISALSAFDQALTLRQVSNLYTGTVVRRARGIHFEPSVQPSSSES